MAVWSIIPRSHITNRLRIEAEFYKPEYLQCYNEMLQVPHKALRQAAELITDGTHFTPHYVSSGVRFYSAVNVLEGRFDSAGAFKWIRPAEHEEIHRRCPVRAGDVLLRKVGVGPRWSCVIPKGLDEFSIFVSVAMVRPKAGLDPYFLSTFVNTRRGQLQLLRLNKGITQPDLHLEDIGELLIPDLPKSDQKEIAALVQRAEKAEIKATSTYATAEQLLSDALKLNSLHFQRPLSYTTKFSEVMAQGRADADYFQIPYVQLRECVLNSAGGYIPLTDLCDFLRPNINPAKAPNDQFNYVELADINSGLGLIDACESYCGAALPSRARRQVRVGDVLASAVVGSIDKSAVVGRKQDGFVASTGFFHLRPKPGVPPEFLLMLMRSSVVQMQLQQQATGGILSAVPDSRVKYILVPRIGVAVQKEVAKLVKTAHKKHTESLALLEEAKARVEQLIEEAAKKV